MAPKPTARDSNRPFPGEEFEVTVKVENDKIVFEGGSGGGNVIVTEGQAASIHLQLAESSFAAGARLLGIKFAQNSGDLSPLTETALRQVPVVAKPGDSGTYDPLDVTFSSEQSIDLLDINPGTAKLLYYVGVETSSGEHLWSDPRIYNNGGGPLPGDPGSGLATTQYQHRLVAGGIQVLSGSTLIDVLFQNQEYQIEFAFPFQSKHISVVATLQDPGYGYDFPTTALGTRSFSPSGFSLLTKTFEFYFVEPNLEVSWIAMGPAIC